MHFKNVSSIAKWLTVVSKVDCSVKNVAACLGERRLLVASVVLLPVTNNATENNHIAGPPVLEFLQFLVDFLNIHLNPRNIIVAIHFLNDVIVQSVELLQQVQLLSNLVDFWEFCCR